MPKRHDTLTSQLVNLIRDEITQGDMPPGTLISAVRLAEKFGVSRTPIREAVLQLEHAGMVRIEKNRGIRILPTTLDDLIEVFQIRLMLEVPLVARVAHQCQPEQLADIQRIYDQMQRAADAGDRDLLLRYDRDFHLTLLKFSGTQRAITMLRDLRNLVLTRGVGTIPSARSEQALVDDHRDIVAAIEQRDPRAAAAAMRRHIINTATLLVVQEADGDPGYSADAIAHRLQWVNEFDLH